MDREMGKSELAGSIQSYQKWNIEIWSKDEPVKV